jgi:hypothetical protein
MKLTPEQVDELLFDLCVDLGFCLRPEHNDRLMRDPPADVQSFARAVLVAEGMNPEKARPGLIRAVEKRIELSFESARGAA